MTESAAPRASGRPDRVQWLELFFDLVVVAAVSVLAETLREDSSMREMGLFLISYTAVWFAWVNVVMYADVAAELTRVRTVIVSMFLLAVMAASDPGHFEGRANAFALAFVLVRVFAARDSLRTGRLMTSWPLLQVGGYTLPWLVSLAVPSPYKYWLWALGLALDLLSVVRRPHGMRDDERRRLARQASHHDRHHDGHPDERRRGGRSGSQREQVSVTEVRVDREHIEDRLGTFMIIVLGESVAALVLRAAQEEWTREFVGVAMAGFVLLVLLWLLTFSYGFATSPGGGAATLSLRTGLPVHLLGTLGILLIGVALGVAADQPEPLEGLMLWTLLCGVSLHSSTSLAGGLLGRASSFWVWTCGVPSVLFPLLVGGIAELWGLGGGPARVVWLALLPVLWQFLYAQRSDALLALRQRTEEERTPGTGAVSDPEAEAP